MMTALLTSLRNRGADIDGTMDRFLGDEVLYAECFHLFLQDPGFETLGQALAQKDSSAAFDAAHSLKGVAGNLGLTPLYNAICAIVEPLRQGQSDGLEDAYHTILTEKAALDALV